MLQADRKNMRENYFVFLHVSHLTQFLPSACSWQALSVVNVANTQTVNELPSLMSLAISGLYPKFQKKWPHPGKNK